MSTSSNSEVGHDAGPAATPSVDISSSSRFATGKSGETLMPWPGAFATLVVLILLYFAFILRDWHYIEDVRAMVVPFVTFGLFAGTLLSIMPMTRLAPRRWRSTCVFVVATCVPVGALIIHLNLIGTLGFAPVAAHPEYKVISQTFYRAFALCAIGFFGATALSGYYAARAINESLAARLHFDTLEKKARHELVTTSVTALIGIAGAIVTALVGGKGGH